MPLLMKKNITNPDGSPNWSILEDSARNSEFLVNKEELMQDDDYAHEQQKQGRKQNIIYVFVYAALSVSAVALVAFFSCVAMKVCKAKRQQETDSVVESDDEEEEENAGWLEEQEAAQKNYENAQEMQIFISQQTTKE